MRDVRPEPGAVPVLTTDRVLLRGFRPGDVAAFARMNADPVVMEHYVRPLSPEETTAFVARIRDTWHERGWGLWALEHRDSGAFLGYTGLWPVRFEAPFPHRVEIGWRLARPAWGQGFATEAARAAARFAFTEVGLGELVSFTSATNVRSQAVMRRLGMSEEPDWAFDHPAVPEGHPLRPHVVYRLCAPGTASGAGLGARP